MVAVRIVVFALGATVVVLTVHSAIRTILVPRALQASLSRFVFVLTRRVFYLRANHRHDYEHRDRVMAFYAPFALLVLLSTWLVLLLLGYTAMFWALEDVPPTEAFVLAGSSMFTLGFAGGSGFWEAALSFTAAAMGLFLLALLITYLPTLYAAFQRREAGVTKLEVRAGAPPTGVYLLELAWTVGRLDSLHELWRSWEDWFVDIDESHTSFPALAFFRSPHSDASWVTASGAILDGASLYVSCVDLERSPDPEFMIRSGYLCLRHIAEFFGITVDPDPSPLDPVTIMRAEFEEAYERMAATGLPLHADRDRCWRDFAGWRVNYDAALVGLARLTMAPPAPWSSDRYIDAHWVPPVRRPRGGGGKRSA